MIKKFIICLFIICTVLFTLPLFSQEEKSNQDSLDKAGRIIKRLDLDKNKKLDKKEYPEQQMKWFDKIDTNKDGFIEQNEQAAFFENRKRPSKQKKKSRDKSERVPRITPTHPDLEYGSHEKQRFDLWLAESKKPTPLLIYIHGGGFRGGDKKSVNNELLKKMLDKGVSFMSLNYRLSDVGPYPMQMMDCARALQFIRLNAKKYNIDPKRIGAYGGSAGSGISQWLAFHDDLADPKSKDPLLRQSTRLKAIAPYNAQTTYDPRAIQKLFDTTEINDALIAFYGMETPEDVNNPKFHPLFEAASPINHLTKDDPPAFFHYKQANEELPPNSSGGKHIHHPKFGILIKEKMDKLGIECILRLREDTPQFPVDEIAEFFFKHFDMKK